MMMLVMMPDLCGMWIPFQVQNRAATVWSRSINSNR
jgi:hypothetical protein